MIKWKSIWVHTETHARLELMRGKKESFNDVIERLCSTAETIAHIRDTLGPNHPITAGPRDQEGG